MFGFDERFAMFDMTPVDNLFILEYLPEAKGDYVRVYLYGLMRCYHPEQGMTLDRMSHELNMTEDDICAAYRYWERRGLVRRVCDQPPKWEYINVQHKNAESDGTDPEYEKFSLSVYDAFDNVRRLHGSEISSIFEWHEDLNLPTEVIIMLLHHMVEVKGKNFRISDAEKVALRMAQEDIRNTDAAENFFSRDESIYSGIRRILKLLGKHYMPSEAQTDLYRKWVHEWHFTSETIEAAAGLTVRGDPTLPYLDGILKSLMEEYGDGAAVTPQTLQASDRHAQDLRQVLKILGQGAVTQENLALLSRMQGLYPLSVILTGARECRNSRKGMEDLYRLLEAWHDKGLTTPGQVEQYVREFHDQTELIRKLRGIWGLDTARISRSDREYLTKWTEEMGFSRDMIIHAAAFASEAKQPMAYLGKILSEFHKKGIRTPEAADAERKKVPAASASGSRKVIAQQYDQRDYSDVQDQLLQQQAREMEEYIKNKGGASDA